MRRAAAALLLAVAVGGARAQEADGGLGPVEVLGPVEGCRLPVGPIGEAPVRRRRARPVEAPCPPAARTATFAVTYDGFPADAQRAFQAALDTWACAVATDRPIEVRAVWEPLAAATLGSAGPTLYRNTAGLPARRTWYPAALAEAFAGRDLGGRQPDIAATFNSTFPAWHLDPDTPPPPTAYDLYTVVLHEVAHGLGLIGAMTVEDGRGHVGGAGGPRGPYVYDRFTVDGAGIFLLDERAYPDGSAALAGALREAVRFDGPAVDRVRPGGAPLQATPTWVDGGSYSHLDEATFAEGTGPDALMTPFIGRGERIEAPGPVVCALLADLGWALGPACLGVGEPAPDVGLALALAGPNPVRHRTAVRVRAAVPQRVVVELVDVLGRRPATLADRYVRAGEAAVVDVEAGRLAAGVYVVRARGSASRPVALPVTVLR